jgi:N6-adenosine-specific RNA methylase IME4
MDSTLEPIRFDYTTLDSDTQAFLQEKVQDIRYHLKRTAEDVIAIGLDLIAVKERLPKQFENWLKTEFDLSLASARYFMSIARRFGNKQPPVTGDLGIEVLKLLSSPSTPDTVIEMVESGQIPATETAIREARQAIIQAETREIPVDVQPSFYLPPAPIYYHEPMPTPAWEREREIKREIARERIADLRENGAQLPTGQYSCLVVDPPWPMQKIERDVRPNQVEFDYPTMDEEELKAFPLPDLAADNCHLYLWTTQKHLPLALRLAEHWGFKYQCLLTWVKNVGFTPFSWMYSTEHVLFCTKGNLPLLRLGKRLDFETMETGFKASVREHSRKPDVFYEIVKQVSPAPRLDVFSREKRDGFDQYGNEVEKYVATR